MEMYDEDYILLGVIVEHGEHGEIQIGELMDLAPPPLNVHQRLIKHIWRLEAFGWLEVRDDRGTIISVAPTPSGVRQAELFRRQ